MGESTDGIVLKQIQTLYNVGAIGGLSDSQLGEHVLAGRDDDAAEAAFTILAERHGPMVFRICRQMLRDRHDAEDAFQATFLVLASKAHSIRNRDSLASWLHGVARRVALRARADAARRRIHERRRAVPAEAHSPEDDDASHGESWPVLHEEIARLPERYREPVVLCYLKGLTTEAASQRLGCPQGTILSRLSRARDRLRRSLTRRGLTLPAGLLTLELCRDVAMAVPAALLSTTVRASLSFTARQTAGATVASASAVGLARGVLYAMTLSQWKTFGAATLGCVLTMGSLQVFAQYGGIGADEKAIATEPVADDRQAVLSQAVEKIMAELYASSLRNAELQKQLQTIRAELKTLRAGPPSAPGNDTRTLDRTTSEPVEPTAEGSEGNKGQPRVAPNGHQEASLKFTTVTNQDVSALMLSGPKITRIAASRTGTGRWITQDLHEPVTGRVVPTIRPGAVFYTIDRYIYAFSSEAQRWDVLELPGGIEELRKFAPKGPTPTMFEAGGHIYTFDLSRGKWEDVDVSAILDVPGAESVQQLQDLRGGLGQAPFPKVAPPGPTRP